MPSSISTRASTFSTFLTTTTTATISPFLKPQTSISINGDNALSAYRTQPTYTTHSRITGTVQVVSPNCDVRFDEVLITFEGTTRTWLDRLGPTPASSGRTYTEKTFLKLTQPIDDTLLPIPRLLTKSKTYTFPFEFVIPAKLLPSACSHRHSTSGQETTEWEEHLQLPPTSGDPTLPDANGALVDDLFPDMLRIAYSINARIIRRREVDNKPLVLSSSARRVRVMPYVEDAPPIMLDSDGAAGGVGAGGKRYVLTKEKDVKKSLFKPRLGRLQVSANQPTPLHLHDPNKPSCPSTTMIPISLLFTKTTPSSSTTPPPKLSTVTTKLRTHTTFSTTPQPHTLQQGTLGLVGNYSATQTLSTRCIANTPWTGNEAKLSVPVSPPKGVMLVPSFSTCLGARSYVLEVIIGVHNSSSITLRIPLQVSFPPPVGAGDGVGVGVGVEEYFTPRSVAPPSSPVAEEEEEEEVVAVEREGQLPPHMRPRANLPPERLPAFAFPPMGGEGGVVRIPSPVGISPGCG
ncbi:unnamed protein product [Tuber melanosporum]|uniref:(Perigord truffle) hypothetical protein n=1 Tax=Tuber melanosporum (strain Mel28) TaxID=656061 RepID=D5G6A4_TUBMM|nr:uncharacterized protein GSTUM_00001676001 [Tuber melanosporum]CAZ80047.1 unnamed protein product [Tuber melanosporum]